MSPEYRIAKCGCSPRCYLVQRALPVDDVWGDDARGLLETVARFDTEYDARAYANGLRRRNEANSRVGV